MAGTATFFPGEDDYLAALRAHQRGRFRGRGLRRLLWVVVIAVLAVMAVTALIDPDPFAAVFTGIGGVVGGLGALLLFLLLGRFLLPRWSRRLYRQQRTLHQDHHVAWDDVGVRWQNASGDSRYPWDAFHGWREGHATFLVYLNDQLFHFIPQRALDRAAIDDLRATLAAHGPQRAT